MTFIGIVFAALTVFNAILAVILIKMGTFRLYVNKIAKKFGRDEFEKYQLFFDKEILQQVLKEFKISGRTTNMFLEAKNYFLMISMFDAKLYYSFPGTEYGLMPYEELSIKQLYSLIEKASVKPIPNSNVLYFSKYEAGV